MRLLTIMVQHHTCSAQFYSSKTGLWVLWWYVDALTTLIGCIFSSDMCLHAWQGLARLGRAWQLP